MHSFFKFVLYFGAIAGLVGFLWPQFSDYPALRGLPPITPKVLSFGGLGLVVIGLVGRSATRPEPKGEWK